MVTLYEAAYAKINLTLDVLKKQGYNVIGLFIGFVLSILCYM